MSRVVNLFVGGIAGAALGLAVGHINAQDRALEEAQHRQYCEDVALHREYVARGHDPAQSPGHPDWDGIYDDYCP